MTAPPPPSPLDGLIRRARAWLDRTRAGRMGSTTARPTALQIAIWIGIVAASAATALHDYDSFQLGAYQDDAVYVILARSLAFGPRYGATNLSGAPAPAGFPFGYPLLLAPLARLFPADAAPMKLLSLAASLIVNAVLFWGWPRLGRGLSHWWALASASLYAMSPLTIDHARMVMSEPIFTAVCLIALCLAADCPHPSRKLRWDISLGIALTLLVFIRSIGVVFVAVIVADLFLALGRSGWRRLVSIGLAGAASLALAVAFTPLSLADLTDSNACYVEDYRAFITGTSRHRTLARLSYAGALVYLAGHHVNNSWRPVLLPVGGGAGELSVLNELGLPLAQPLLNYGLTALVGVGFWIGMRRTGPAPFWLTALAYYGLISFWNWDGTRLLYPIQPQIYLAFAVGSHQVLAWAAGRLRLSQPGRLSGGVLAVWVAGLCAVFGYKSWTIDDSRLHVGDLSLRTAWIGAHSDPADVVMTEALYTDHLYSGRSTVPLAPADRSSRAVLDYFAAHHVTYVLVAPELKWQVDYTPTYSPAMQALLPRIAELAAQGRVARVYELPEDSIAVYWVNPTPAP